MNWPNKSDAGNCSNGICRVIGASRLSSSDLQCSANMKTHSPSIIRVRYGFYPIMIIALIGLIVGAFSPPLGAVAILAITLPFLIAFCIRPFLLVAADDARFVSLISDQISRPISKEELSIRLPSMKWFLRKRDLALLSAIQNSDRACGTQHE